MAYKKVARKKVATRRTSGGASPFDVIDPDPDDHDDDSHNEMDELDRLLQATATEASWNEVMDHLFEALEDDDAVRAACEKVAAVADRWDDRMRTAPYGTGNMATMSPDPRLALIRTMDPDADHAWITRPETADATGLLLRHKLAKETTLTSVLAQVVSRKLERITLTGLGLKDHDLAALSDWPGIAAIRELDLPFNTFTTKGLAALALSSLTSGLEVLDLSGQAVGDQGVRVLFAPSSQLHGLRVLKLNNTQFNDAAARAIASSPNVSRLRELHIQNAILTTDGVIALADCEALASLEVLDLGEANFTGDCLWPIAASPYLRNLKSLRLNGCDLDADAGAQLARWPALATLEELELGSYDSDAGIAAFFRARPSFTAMRRLVIHNINLDDDDDGRAIAEAIGSSGLPDTLEEFGLMGVYPDSAILGPLLARPAWKNLKKLDLDI